jgi:ubiquinol-cytochrome c reductase cytochrome b subunit
VADCIILVWIGQEPVEDPYIIIGQLASVYFFIYFLIFMPFLGKLESFLIHYKGESTADFTALQTLASAR